MCQPTEQNNQMNVCCGQCPFARSTPKEYLDTRGQNGERFAGQSIGAFALPCHMRSEFDEFRTNPHAAPLCAGAAKFRANIEVADKLSPRLGRLPADTVKVFASHAELLAHHEGISIEEAQIKLTKKSVREMLADELQKAGVQIISVNY